MRHLARAISFATIFFTFVSLALAENVSPHEAHQYIGYKTSVEGVVSQVATGPKGTTFINFGGRYPNHVFYAVIFRNFRARFDHLDVLEGRLISITGKIQSYKGKPQIILRSPDQIEIRD